MVRKIISHRDYCCEIVLMEHFCFCMLNKIRTKEHFEIGEPMSTAIFFILTALFSCTESKKGNPQLVKDAQEIAQLGCKCKDVKCLHKVKVRGQSYVKIRLGAGVKDLKEDERMKFNQALGKWAECEYEITLQQNKGK